MAAEDRILKILLQLREEGAAQATASITSNLQKVEAQATKTAAAVARVTTGSAGQRITDTSIPAPDTRTNAELAAGAALRAQLDAQYKARLAAQGAAGQVLALDEKSVITAELRGAAEARRVLQMERQVVMEIQLEAAEARIAGNPTMAAKLEREAAIRLQALTIQRATNVSMEVAIAQAERLAIAQDIGNVKNAAGINFTRGQATALAQQLANGRVSAESISRSFSGFGSYLSIAAVAGYGLYNVFSNLRSLSTELTKDYEDQVRELSNQVSVWTDLAHEANSFSDIVKLGGQMLQPLDEFTKKLDEISKRKLTFGQTLTDLVGLNQFVGAETNEQAAATGAANQTQLLQERLELAKSLLDVAAQSKRAFDAINILPLADAIDKVTGSSEELRAKHEQLRTQFIDALNKAGELRKLADERARYESPEDQKESTRQWQAQLEIARQLYGQLVQTGHALDQNDSRLKSITGEAETLDRKTKDIAEGIRKWELSALPANERIPQLNHLLDETLQKLVEIGVTETDPAKAAAQIQSIDLTKEQKTEANALLLILLEIVKAIRGANDEQEKNDERSRREATNAARREQAEQQRRLREAQRDITSNPFLSVADKNAQLIPLLLQEAAAHEKAGDAAAAHAAKMQALALTFGGDLQANITAWANSFGTAAQQIGGFITGSINAALQTTNQLIVDAVFATGDWRQTVIALEKQLLNMFLTVIEQMILQHVLGESQKAVSTTTSVTQGATVAAAQAPAAAATSIASWGTSAVVGAAAAVAAIGLIIGMLASGGFARGGPTRGRRNEVAGVVHGEEYVFDADATRLIGLENLAALHRSAPRFGSGGRVNSGLGWELGEYPLIGSELPNDFFQQPRGRGPTVQINHEGPRIAPGGRIPDHLKGPFAVESGSIEIDLGEDYPKVETPTWSMDDEPQLFGDPGLNLFGGAGAYVDRTGAAGNAQFVGGLGIVGLGQAGAAAVTAGNSAGYDASGNFTGYMNTAGTSISGGANFDLTGVGGAANAILVGHDVLTGGPVYRDTITGRIFVEPGTGHAPGYIGYGQSSLSAASQLLMASQAFGGMPNRVDVGDAGRSLFGTPSKGTGYVDEFGFIVRRPNSYIFGGADGMRLPGGPSRTDSILSYLAPGEQVTEAFETAAIDRMLGGRDWAQRIARFGLDWDKKLDVRVPRMAQGGRVGAASSSSSSSSSGRRAARPTKIIFVGDMKAAAREAQREPEYQVLIRDIVNSSRHELALPAVE